jgi:hypothetical protein
LSKRNFVLSGIEKGRKTRPRTWREPKGSGKNPMIHHGIFLMFTAVLRVYPGSDERKRAEKIKYGEKGKTPGHLSFLDHARRAKSHALSGSGRLKKRLLQ